MSKLVKIDEEYSKWLQKVSQRYQQSQIKAAVRVNTEMLEFYWSLGKDIVDLHAENRWGSGFMNCFLFERKICPNLGRKVWKLQIWKFRPKLGQIYFPFHGDI